MKTTRNGAFGFWKFIFCMVIVLHYAYFFNPQKAESGSFLFYRGELAFDFFFLLAGMMLAESVNRIPEDRTLVWSDTRSFLKVQLRRYLPGLIICWIISFAVLNTICWIDLESLNTNFFASMLELLPVHSAGFNIIPPVSDSLVGYRVMDQAWVFSAVMLAFFVLYPLYLSNRKRFEYYIAPVGAALLLGFLFFKTQVLTGDNLMILDAKNKELYFLTPGAYKAFGEILAGVACYALVRHLSGKQVSRGKAHLLSLVEVGGYVAALAYMQRMLALELPKRFDYLAAGCILIAAAVTLSGKSSLSKPFDNRFFRFLGRFSLYPFLTFLLFAKTLTYFLPDAGIKKLTVIYLALTLASAVLLMLAEKPFVRAVKSLKRLFIKPCPQSRREEAA